MIVPSKTTADQRAELRPLGMELFEITPVILGGDPVDSKNKVWLTRQQHIEAVRYWNRVVSDLRQPSCPAVGQALT